MNKGFQLTALVLIVSLSVSVSERAGNADMLKYGIVDRIYLSAPKPSPDDHSTSGSIKKSWRADLAAVDEVNNTRESGKLFVDRLPGGDESMPLKEGQENLTVVPHNDEPYQPFIVETDEADLERRIEALESKITPATSVSDRVLCKTALSKDGRHWEGDPEFNSVIAEAQERNLSIRKCRAILTLDAEIVTEEAIEAKRMSPTRVISLSRKASGESITLTYLKDTKYIPSAMKKISYLLRDLETDKVVEMSDKVIDLLWELHADLGSKRPIEIVGAYSDPDKPSANPSSDSELEGHGAGRAVDFYFPDVPANVVEKSAIVRQVGGVYAVTVDDRVVIHIDTYPEKVDIEKVKKYSEAYRKSVGARVSKKKPLSEERIAEADPTAAMLPSQDEDSDTDVKRTIPRNVKEQKEAALEVTTNLGCLSFGGQGFDCVPIISKSGLGTRKAAIKVKPTLKSAIEACAEVFSKDTPKGDIQKCGEENYSEQKSLKRAVYADCRKKTWTDLYGQQFALLGRKRNAVNTDEKYIVIRRDNRNKLTGTPYFTALGVFARLCPSTLPEKGW